MLIILIISILITRYIATIFNSIYIKNFHIHHWVWGLGGVFLSSYFDYKYLKIIFLGITTEGLTYDDWYKI